MDNSQLVRDLEVLEVAFHQVEDRRVARTVGSAIVDLYERIYDDLGPAEKLAVSRGLRTAAWKSAGKVLAQEVGDPEGWSAAIYRGRHVGNYVVEYYVRDEYLEGENYVTDTLADAVATAENRLDPQNRPWG